MGVYVKSLDEPEATEVRTDGDAEAVRLAIRSLAVAPQARLVVGEERQAAHGHGLLPGVPP
jgi:hypothetical protein